MKRYRIIRKFISEQILCKILIGITIIFLGILISGCVESEQTYAHNAPQNYTEYITLYPDGTWTGIFYEDRYFPQIPLSGTYRITKSEIVLVTPTGNTIIFTKSGKNLIFEGDVWE